MKSVFAREAARPICPNRSRWESSSRPFAIFWARAEGASMSARILVVDDVPANVKLLEARLSAEYLDVVTAYNVGEDLGSCDRGEYGIVLVHVIKPEFKALEVCRQPTHIPQTHHIPVN